jgi:gamma-glutamylcyclotransferase (GGCT)/AIG2-like uncharacterized protein YtfP
MDREYLFVYGTLRKEYKLGIMEKLAAHLVFTGKGKVQATLYDLGTYPAALANEQQHEIWGDVYEVTEADKLFPVLDEYEGDEYKRQKTEVKLETEERLDAWIYWYSGPVDESLQIQENDYLDYLKNKKTV